MICVGVVALVVWATRSRNPFGLGLALAAGLSSVSACWQALRGILGCRNVGCELGDALLLTDWRGRTRELNWSEVTLGQGTSRLQIIAGGEVIMEIGAREFEDGYTLINELARRVRAAHETPAVKIIPFPPTSLKENEP